jgi:Glycosyltransferase like family
VLAIAAELDSMLAERRSRSEGIGTSQGNRGLRRREPVSIVCVFNDAEVRARCLDASISALRHEAPSTEYLLVDNTNGAFRTAGAALNHGTSLATHDYVVFVHQDVYLHSLAALEYAAGQLADDTDIGMLGATGVSSHGSAVGQIRDRVVLLGEPAVGGVEVDSLDEVLVMIPVDRLQSGPLVDSELLAWHAYAVEYAARGRRDGLRTVATHIPLTHNSMTLNLARLDEAHAEVARLHPQALPLNTTCGPLPTVGRRQGRLDRLLRPHRWRYTWLRESLLAHRARRRSGHGGPVVLSDIRRDIDHLAAGSPEPVRVYNVDGARAEADYPPVELRRGSTRFEFRCTSVPGVTAAVGELDQRSVVLVTNLAAADVTHLPAAAAGSESVLGYHRGIGFWLLYGIDAGAFPGAWRQRRAVPLGMRAAR